MTTPTMMTIRIPVTENLRRDVKRLLACTGLLHEGAADPFMDENGTMTMAHAVAFVEHVNSETPHVVTRPLALAKAALKAAEVMGTVPAGSFLRVFPDETADAPAAVAAPTAPRAPKAPTAKQIAARAAFAAAAKARAAAKAAPPAPVVAPVPVVAPKAPRVRKAATVQAPAPVVPAIAGVAF